MVATDEPAIPHYYFSTFCIHDLHDKCRLTCKTCLSHCRCDCHLRTDTPTEQEAIEAAARDALITAAHDYDGIHRWRRIKAREALAAGVKLYEVADILGVSRQTAARWCN